MYQSQLNTLNMNMLNVLCNDKCGANWIFDPLLHLQCKYDVWLHEMLFHFHMCVRKKASVFEYVWVCLSVLSMTVVMKWHAILSIVWICVLFSILKNSPANTLEKLYTYASHDDANKSTHWNTQHSIQVIHCLFCERDFFPTFNETQSIHKLFISSNELWNYSVDGASQKGNGELNESACAHGKWTDDREFMPEKGTVVVFQLK